MLNAIRSKFKIPKAHDLQILDLDFNPCKQYTFVTCSEDCLLKFWDLRKTAMPLKIIEDF